MEAIGSIKEKRTRPSFNTILSFINRGEVEAVDMAAIKETCQGLLSSGNIMDKGKPGLESFISCTKITGNEDNPVDLNSSRVVIDKVFEDIDESIIYNIISEKIQSEVNSQLPIMISEQSEKINYTQTHTHTYTHTHTHTHTHTVRN